MKAIAAIGLAACLAATGCNSTKGLVPDKFIKVTPNMSVTMEELVFWGGAAAAAYVVLDPLAPNWEVQEAQFPEDRFHLSLQMKRYYSGGAGEARVIFHRRARELAATLGYDGYQVIEYSERLDSSVVGSQRRAEGVVQLTRKLG